MSTRLLVPVVACVLAILPATALAQPAPGRFPDKPHAWVDALAGTPDALFLAHDRYVTVVRRGAADSEFVGSLSQSVEDVAVSADGQVVAAAGGRGTVGRLVGDHWETGEAEVPASSRYRDNFKAVAVADDGTVYAASDTHGVYVWRGGTDWVVLPWPAAAPGTRAAEHDVATLALVGGTPVVGASDGFTARWDGAAWVPLAGVGRDTRDLWLDAGSGTLYVLDGFGVLFAVDTGSWQPAGRWDLDLFGPLSLHGVVDPQTGQLVLGIGAQSTVGLWSNGLLRELPLGLSFVHGAWFDPQTELLYTANRDGLLGRWVGDAFERDRATGRRTALAGTPAQEPVEPGATKLSWRLGLDISQGPLWVVHPRAQAAAYNLTLQVRSTWLWQDEGTGFGLVGSLGYSFEDTKVSGHMVELGLGLVYRQGVWLGITYLPRAVLGSPEGRFGAGLRHGVVVDTLLGLIAVEVSHQAVWADGGPRHDVRMTFGVDLFMVYQMIVLHHFLFSWL